MNIMFNFVLSQKNKIIKKLSYQSHFPFLKWRGIGVRRFPFRSRTGKLIRCRSVWAFPEAWCCCSPLPWLRNSHFSNPPPPKTWDTPSIQSSRCVLPFRRMEKLRKRTSTEFPPKKREPEFRTDGAANRSAMQKHPSARRYKAEKVPKPSPERHRCFPAIPPVRAMDKWNRPSSAA